MHFIKNKKGQGLVEYLILVALMAVATMSVVRLVSQNVEARFAKISQVLHGKTDSDNDIRMDKFTDTDIKKKDMGNFYKGATSHGNSK